MSFISYAMQAAMKMAVEMAPDSWLPGGKPDPLIGSRDGLIGKSVSRVDGALKVRGQAPFAAEIPMSGLLYAAVTYSTIPRGRIAFLDVEAAEQAPGVKL